MTYLLFHLQWTPKDDLAALKLHGKCDDVMQLLMDELGFSIPCYDRSAKQILCCTVAPLYMLYFLFVVDTNAFFSLFKRLRFFPVLTQYHMLDL